MTVREIIAEVHEKLGYPSNIDPYVPRRTGTLTLSSAGGIAYLREVNSAMTRIATWKDPRSGMHYRPRSLVKPIFLKSEVLTGTLTADGTVSTVPLPTGIVEAAYEGWTVRINSEDRKIVSSPTSGVLEVVPDMSAAPVAGDTYSLHAPWVTPDAAKRVYTVFSVATAEDGGEISQASAEETFVATRNEVGSPERWTYRAGKICFDAAPEETTWWQLEAYCLPQSVSAESDVPDLPDAVHPAIVLSMLEAGFRTMQETDQADSYFARLRGFFQTLKQEGDVQNELTNGYDITPEVT